MLLAACVPSTPDPAAPGVAPNTVAPSGWTVAVWMAADNNLEPLVGGDLAELEAAVTDQVRIVVQADRSPDYSRAGGDWADTRRFEVARDPEPGVVTDVGPSIGEVDMGDGAALAEFLLWANDHYPAEHFAVVLWNHGGGYWIASDDTDGGSKIDIAAGELSEALAPLVAARGSVDVVAFDACNMGQWEVAVALSHAGVTLMTASQAWVNFGGYAYDVAFPSLPANADARTFADALATSAGPTNGELTHAAIDLVAVAAVTDAIDVLAAVWLDGPDVVADFRRARDEARGLDRVWEDFWLDLGELADAAGRSADPAVVDAGVAVRQALGAAVVTNVADERVAFASGLTIFADTSVPRWLDRYAAGPWARTTWDELLQVVAIDGPSQ